MNKRKLKKSLKKAKAEALQNQNEYLKRENIKLRREVIEAKEGLEEVYASFYAIVGTITKYYGEAIEGYIVIDVPIEEARTVLDNYDIKCSIEDEKYIICALPKVDPEG